MMQITKIVESGANNILTWAINNNANIKNDTPLQSLINNELFYLVTFSNVNFLEMFRLTQMYREKLRVINEYEAETPSDEELAESFQGEYTVNKEEGKDEQIQFSTLSKEAIDVFIDIVLQMHSDDDIISSDAAKLFLPMLSRKFDVQIPISFIDFIDSMSEEEAIKIFTPEYPHTLHHSIIDAPMHGVKTALYTGFVRGTAVIRYDSRYNHLVNALKYAALKKMNTNKLYRFQLTGFHKFDNISRGEIRCELFNIGNDISSTLKAINNANTPLKLDFAIQLPLHYMQILLNSFDRETLPVLYESPMATIIEDGISCNDFITVSYNNDDIYESPINEFNNQLEAYRIRITHANSMVLNAINAMIQNNDGIDVTAMFAILPSMYTTKAVVTVDVSKTDQYINHSNPLISCMFREIFNSASGILEDIESAK